MGAACRTSSLAEPGRSHPAGARQAPSPRRRTLPGGARTHSSWRASLLPSRRRGRSSSPRSSSRARRRLALRSRPHASRRRTPSRLGGLTLTGGPTRWTRRRPGEVAAEGRGQQQRWTSRGCSTRSRRRRRSWPMRRCRSAMAWEARVRVPLRSCCCRTRYPRRRPPPPPPRSGRYPAGRTPCGQYCCSSHQRARAASLWGSLWGSLWAYLGRLPLGLLLTSRTRARQQCRRRRFCNPHLPLSEAAAASGSTWPPRQRVPAAAMLRLSSSSSSLQALLLPLGRLTLTVAPRCTRGPARC